jgi:hypothetical protein
MCVCVPQGQQRALERVEERKRLQQTQAEEAQFSHIPEDPEPRHVAEKRLEKERQRALARATRKKREDEERLMARLEEEERLQEERRARMREKADRLAAVTAERVEKLKVR